MNEYRHATERTDWLLAAECPNNADSDEHLSLEAEATQAGMEPREAFPIEKCPMCGAPLDFIAYGEPTEVLD